jgi:hypothetical protein
MKQGRPKQAKVQKVMHEFKTGPVVKNRKQAIAIAISEQQKANKGMK